MYISMTFPTQFLEEIDKIEKAHFFKYRHKRLSTNKTPEGFGSSMDTLVDEQIRFLKVKDLLSYSSANRWKPIVKSRYFSTNYLGKVTIAIIAFEWLMGLNVGSECGFLSTI